MLKSDLINRLAALNPGLSVAECHRTVDAFFDTMSDHLAQGGRIELRGFGAFALSNLHERRASNPNTGEAITASAKTVIRFRSGRHMHERLNPSSC